LAAISLSSACWGSANFCTPSSIKTFSSFAWSTLRSISSSTFCGGISSIARLLGPGAGKDHLLLERELLVRPECDLLSPAPLGVHDPHQALGRGREVGHMLLGVYVHPGDEDAVDALKGGERLLASLRTAPDGVPRDTVLPDAEDERHIQRHTCGSERFEGSQTRRRGGHLDHPVAAPLAVLLPKFDVPAHAHVVGRATVGILEQRVQFVADVAVVAVCLLPHRQEYLLRVGDESIGHVPGDVRI